MLAIFLRSFSPKPGTKEARLIDFAADFGADSADRGDLAADLGTSSAGIGCAASCLAVSAEESEAEQRGCVWAHDSSMKKQPYFDEAHACRAQFCY